MLSFVETFRLSLFARPNAARKLGIRREEYEWIVTNVQGDSPSNLQMIRDRALGQNWQSTDPGGVSLSEGKRSSSSRLEVLFGALC
jgi:hypothetical protein